MNIDPRIGALNSGKFYAFVNGYHAPAVEGTLEEVEIALGLRKPAVKARAAKPAQTYVATVSCPDGSRLQYEVTARSKTEARAEVRKLYRQDVPAPRYGFFSFEQCRLTWE
jgi:hypothetical protein